MVFVWTDYVNGFVADPDPINQMGHKVEELDAALAGQFPWALKLADETINNVGALQNDDELLTPVVANATYTVDLFLLQNTNAAAGFKMDFALPGGTTWRSGHFDCNNTQIGIMTTAAITGITGTGADAYVRVESVIVIGGSSGTVQLRWSQNAAHASNAIVRAGARLKLTRVA